MVRVGRGPLLWPAGATLGLDCGTLLAEGDAENAGTEIGAVVLTSPEEPGVLDARPGTEADFVFSEQRGQVVMVLVIKLVSTMMEVTPLWTLVVVTGQLVTVVYVVKLVYSVDSGTRDTVVPDTIRLGVDDVMTDAAADDLVVKVMF